jgi:amino acid transporter
MGRWSLAALMINIMIGSGIFGLPSKVASLTGRQSPLAFVFAAGGIAVIAACFAEVASRFRESGGPYLYTRVAFGRLVGLQTGWLNWLSRSAASAANANLFPDYLAGFWPRLREPFPRAIAVTLLLAVLSAVNVRGVKVGTRVNNLFTIGKLVPLIIFILAGCVFLLLRGTPVPMVPESHGTDAWLNSVLLILFVYVGFEAALIPAGEATNPDRDAPVAILFALGICTPIYALVQFVIVQTLADPAQSGPPLAAAAHVFGGPVLSAMLAFGALLSVVGYFAAGMIATPRILFALAQQNDLPRWFASVHPRYKTPYVSIVVYAALVWALAMLGTFNWNAKLSSVSRLITYALICGALRPYDRSTLDSRSFVCLWDPSSHFSALPSARPCSAVQAESRPLS